MQPLEIAVVGCGPRGIAVVERIFRLAAATARPLRLTIYEPAQLGVGVHKPELPEYLMLNTVARQATAFADSSMVDPGSPARDHATFLSWCRAKNLSTPAIPPAPETEVGGESFMRRSTFGRFMAEAAAGLLRAAPDHVAVSVCDRAVRQIHQAGATVLLQLEDGYRAQADCVVITTGHGLQHDWTELVRVAGSGGKTTVGAVEAGATTTLEGMGLLAFDVLAALTTGRGGRFERVGRQVTYFPSGEEPAIRMWSRSGRLPFARPKDARHTPREAAGLLTDDQIRELRSRTPDGRLNFIDDVWPALQSALLEPSLSPGALSACAFLLDAGGRTYLDQADYQATLRRIAAFDIAEAKLGLKRSAFKAHVEGLRDARDTLRSVVDEPGLTKEGHRAFFAIVPGLSNRAVVGPQIERLEELLALLQAGTVRLVGGPGAVLESRATGFRLRSRRFRFPQSVDAKYAIRAIVDPAPSVSALLPWAARHPALPDLVALDPCGRVRRNDGSLAPIAVYGPPAEGSSYYNNYVLWPGTRSRFVSEVDATLRGWFDTETTGGSGIA